MAKKAKTKSSSPWDPDARRYGVNKGDWGDPEQWKAAYDQRMGPGEADAVISGSGKTPYDLLGLRPGAGWDEIKKAYRRIVMAECQGAFKVDGSVDPVAEARFKEVNAAYSSLANEFGVK